MISSCAKLDPAVQLADFLYSWQNSPIFERLLNVSKKRPIWGTDIIELLTQSICITYNIYSNVAGCGQHSDVDSLVPHPLLRFLVEERWLGPNVSPQCFHLSLLLLIPERDIRLQKRIKFHS